MSTRSFPRTGVPWALLLVPTALLAGGGCAVRGHIATPDELARLKASPGLSASGRLTLQGPRGKFSAPVVFGVARPGSLRIEIPSGTGLRFLLVAKDGRLRADLPGEDAMFEGPGTMEVMDRLFGVELKPEDLVGALLGDPVESVRVVWRFDRALPAHVAIERANGSRLSLTLDDPEMDAPSEQAFSFGPPRLQSWTIGEMSDHLGLVR